MDAVAIGIFTLVLFVLGQWFDSWTLFAYDFTNDSVMSSVKLGATLIGFLIVHFSARKFSAKVIANKITSKVFKDKNLAGEHREGKIQAGNIRNAFLKNTQSLRSLFRPMPVGWSMRSKRALAQVASDACDFIQTMNDRYTKPSGQIQQNEAARVDAVTEEVAVES